MRLFVFIPILFLIGCIGQHANAQHVETDTAKVFNPFADQQSATEFQMFKNSIALFHSNFTIIQDTIEHSFDNIKSVSNFLAKNAPEIKRTKFFLFIDNKTKFDKTFSVIAALKNNGIENYRVINTDKYFSQPEPPKSTKATAPIVTAVIRELFDSTFFTIAIYRDKLKLSIQNQTAIWITYDSGVEKFIEANKSIIDSNKVQIISAAGVSFERVDQILEVLQKHGFNHFSLITSDTLKE